MNVGIRHATAELHPFEIAFLRNVLGFLLLLPLLLWTGGLSALRTQRIGLHTLRGAFNAVSMLALFLALSLAPLAEVSALYFTSPLFATVLAAVLMKESVGRHRRAALLSGFLGALIVLRPGVEGVGLGTALTLFAAATWACAMMVIKSLMRTESSLTVTAYAALFIGAFSFIPAMMLWRWPSVNCAAWLVAIALMGSLSQLCIARAFSYADTVVVLPFDFLQLIWATLFGYFLFSEEPDLWTWLGGALIIGGATSLGYRERIDKQEIDST